MNTLHSNNPSPGQAIDELAVWAQSASERALSSNGSIFPTFFFRCGSLVKILSADDLVNDTAKNHFRDLARLMAIAENARASVFVFKTWLIYTESVSPAIMECQPDAHESLVLMGEVFGARRDKILPILRDSAANFQAFGVPMVFDEKYAFQSRFWPTLLDRPSTLSKRNAAREHLKRKYEMDSILC